MAATATIPRGTVTEHLVSRLREIFGADGFLSAYNIERDEQIELLQYALTGGIDPLLLGEPGTGKTWLIELLLRCIDVGAEGDTALFSTLLFKETPADDILGPRSLPAMKAGRIERLMAGYLPTAILAYLDEFFKASPTLANSCLDIMANRVLKVGATVHDCSQLLCIFASSNELPDREDLQPVRDRFGITNFVNPVKTPEGRKRVMQIQDQYQADARTVDMSDAPRLTLDEIRQIREEVRRVHLPDTVLESMVTAQEKWAQAKFSPSQRRVGQMLMGIKARAYSRGDGEASVEDMEVTMHQAWNHPDHRAAAREVVMEFAAEFTRKAQQMKQGLEPVLAELDKVRAAINEAGGEPPDNILDQAFDVQKNLRRLRRTAEQQIEQGKAQGHSTAGLEDVLGEINRAFNWIQSTMLDED